MSSTRILRSTDAERRRLRFALADIVMGFPYGEYLYPGAMEAVRKARTLGPVAVLSEGDATFQPHKIWRTGLDPEVDGNVLVFDRKLDHLDEMTAAFPADHYVLVEDKPEILTAVKRALGPRVTTVLVRQGKYGQAPLPEDAPPDLVFESIGALAESDFSLLDRDPAVVGSQQSAASAARASYLSVSMVGTHPDRPEAPRRAGGADIGTRLRPHARHARPYAMRKPQGAYRRRSPGIWSRSTPCI